MYMTLVIDGISLPVSFCVTVSLSTFTFTFLRPLSPFGLAPVYVTKSCSCLLSTGPSCMVCISREKWRGRYFEKAKTKLQAILTAVVAKVKRLIKLRPDCGENQAQPVPVLRRPKLKLMPAGEN